jgi:hypothetical protein
MRLKSYLNIVIHCLFLQFPLNISGCYVTWTKESETTDERHLLYLSCLSKNPTVCFMTKATQLPPPGLLSSLSFSFLEELKTLPDIILKGQLK